MLVSLFVCFAVLAPKLNATSTYSFLEDVEEGFGITSLQGSIHLGNILSGKEITHPFQVLYYITYWGVGK